MWRLNPDLTLDTTFAGGVTTLDFDGKLDAAYAVAVQDDNKILVAGTALIDHTLSFEPDSDFAVARFNDNGTLDGTFHGNGRWTLDRSEVDEVDEIALQSDGR